MTTHKTRLSRLSRDGQLRYRVAVALEQGTTELAHLMAALGHDDGVRVAAAELVLIGWASTRVHGLAVLYDLTTEGRVALRHAREGIWDDLETF